MLILKKVKGGEWYILFIENGEGIESGQKKWQGALKGCNIDHFCKMYNYSTVPNLNCYLLAIKTYS